MYGACTAGYVLMASATLNTQHDNLQHGLHVRRSEDVYELAYCYDGKASNVDVFKRSIVPFVRQLLDGCNVNVVVLGSTGSGKDELLEGEEGNAREQGVPGLMHLLLEHLFQELHTSSVKVRIKRSYRDLRCLSI
jgi:Kinesin motor domain